MKTKKFLGILVSMFLLFSAQGFCQSTLVATLSRGDSLVSVHYGMDALKDAYNKATDGDLITLSSGGFMAVDISKEITIRGAGMEVDTLNNCLPTILIGNFNIANAVQMEGIYHNNDININHRNAIFLKCRLNHIKTSLLSTGQSKNALFMNCKIHSFRLCKSNTASFHNCYVGHISEREQYLNFYNSVIYSNLENVEKCFFNNSVIISQHRLPATNYAENCIGVTGMDIGDLFSNLPSANNKCFNHIGEVFDTNTFDGGDSSDGDTYQLQDSIRTKYLSHDGTEIGLYGGNYPYDPTTYAPKIKKFKVARTSNANGQLEVEIDVVPGATPKNN